MNNQPCNITATEILIRQIQIAEMNYLFKRLWNGRPKGQPHFERNAYTAVIDGTRSVRITSNTHVDWRGLL